MPTSTLTSKGQVTIPKQIRNRLHLKAGDRLLFTVDDKGDITARREKVESVRTLHGLLGHLDRDRVVTVEEMRRAVRNRARQAVEKARNP